MSVRITNTSTYPDAEVRQIVRGVLRDLDCDDVHVKVHRRRGDSGWTTGSYREYWFPRKDEDRPVIRVGLPKVGVAMDEYLPYDRKDGPPPFELRDWQEALVAVTAHEAMHHRQTPRNYYRSSAEVKRQDGRGQARFVEHECDWAAYRAVRRWRER
jgi:hypothetical protein